MKLFLKQIIREYLKTEEGHQLLSQYEDMKRHPGWKVYCQFLAQILEKRGNEMFSDKFTKLDAHEKDIQQRVNNIMYDVLQFLIDPVKAAQSQRKIQRHNQKIVEMTQQMSGSDHGKTR